MKKLRLEFFIFFVLLASLFGGLAFYTYFQMNREEISFWQNSAEQLYNQIQADLSNYLLKEDERSFSEYRYYYVADPKLNSKNIPQVSSLASLDLNHQKGLVGYFQIDPDNSFHSPYLPPTSERNNLSDLNARLAKHQLVKEIIQPLLEKSLFKDEEKPSHKARNTLISKIPQGQDQEIYPNPIQKLVEKKEKQETKSVANKEINERRRETPLKEPSLDRARKPATASTPMPSENTTSVFGRVSTSNRAQQRLFENQEDGSFGGQVHPSSQPPSQLAGLNSTDVKKSEIKELSILTDPFQAQLMDKNYIVFYRKVWIEQKPYLQGFVYQVAPFFQNLLEANYLNSKIASFGQIALSLDNKILFRYRQKDSLTQGAKTFFERELGYPLNKIDFRLMAAKLPPLASKFYLNIFIGLTALLGITGLYVLYRSASLQVLLSQKRQDFVSAVTHELKTPLTSIRMYSEMLKEKWVGEEGKKQEYYEQINRESGRLSRLIENILQMARLEKRTYRANLTQQDPTSDYQSITQELKHIAENQGFEFLVHHIPDSIAKIKYDPEALEQIGMILLENAIKFSQQVEVKKIESKLYPFETYIIWSLRDYGPGIPRRELKRVFEKFYRVESEINRTTKGTGIGLAMAKMLATAMGARILAHNAEGGGLEVQVVFKVEGKG